MGPESSPLDLATGKSLLMSTRAVSWSVCVGHWGEAGQRVDHKNPSEGTSREQGGVSTGCLSRSKVTRSPDLPETEGFPGT